ncbi:sensory neuron membrane protein 1-like [Culicoides brevitarsis]|uniref:sensory neuron membrane protein 1-like n=1 Tax=Culicoides brevitarsis TaxID=469753 RepID=UPI00307BFE85
MKIPFKEKLEKLDHKKVLKISLVLAVSGLFMSLIFVPTLVNTIVKFLTILKPGRFIRSKHEKPVVFRYKIFLWNVTNPDDIMYNRAKPKLQEVGPYVFEQTKQKVETFDNDTEDSYSFDLINVYRFSKELSYPLTGEEQLNMLNLVLVSGMVKIFEERPHLLDTVMRGMDLVFDNPKSIFLSMTADEFIHNGIFLNCDQHEFAGKAVCAEFRDTKTLKMIDGDKTRLRYKWFDKLNNSVQARYTLLRGNRDTNDIGRIIRVNDEPMQNIYKHDSKCNVINGTDKTFFPPFQRKRETIWVYSHDACISFPMVYSHSQFLKGAHTAFKSLYLSDPLMSPNCNCNPYTGCKIPKGTIDMHSCLDIFVLGSFPHFYLAEPSIFETIDGMEPQENIHRTGIFFDLLTGVPVLSLERFQVNFRLKRILKYPIMANLPYDVWIPAFWYEETFTPLKPDLALMVFSQIAKFLGIFSGYNLFVIGLLGCGLAGAKHFLTRNHSQPLGISTIQQVKSVETEKADEDENDVSEMNNYNRINYMP